MADTQNSGGKAKSPASRRTTSRRNAAATGVAIGIGSAALVAALMYANRPKDDKDDVVVPDPRFEPRES